MKDSEKRSIIIDIIRTFVNLICVVVAFYFWIHDRGNPYNAPFRIPANSTDIVYLDKDIKSMSDSLKISISNNPSVEYVIVECYKKENSVNKGTYKLSKESPIFIPVEQEEVYTVGVALAEAMKSDIDVHLQINTVEFVKK